MDEAMARAGQLMQAQHIGGTGQPGLDAARRLLFVHAHPDDEASKGAATAAREAAEGGRVSLVTCTGGEAGEILNEDLASLDMATLPKVRAAELEASVDVLGFAAAYHLGYLDSGWYQDLSEVPTGTFYAEDLDAAAGRLAEVLRRERPQVVVTYPEDGGYPHPDHIKVHAVTMRAVELAAAAPVDPWQVLRVFSSTVWTLEKMIAMDDEHARRDLPRVFVDWIGRRSEAGVEPPSDVRVEVGPWMGHRDRALLAHATQVAPNGPWFRHDRDVEMAVAPVEDFHLILGTMPAGTTGPADDLFDGLV
jgi:mycothiol S-conjugate amidase